MRRLSGTPVPPWANCNSALTGSVFQATKPILSQDIAMRPNRAIWRSPSASAAEDDSPRFQPCVAMKKKSESPRTAWDFVLAPLLCRARGTWFVKRRLPTLKRWAFLFRRARRAWFRIVIANEDFSPSGGICVSAVPTQASHIVGLKAGRRTAVTSARRAKLKLAQGGSPGYAFYKGPSPIGAAHVFLCRRLKPAREFI